MASNSRRYCIGTPMNNLLQYGLVTISVIAIILTILLLSREVHFLIYKPLFQRSICEMIKEEALKEPCH